MEKFKRVEEIESRMKAIDAERISLLKELRDLRAKDRSTNPSFALDDRRYPETVAERVALFERLFVARKDVYPRMWKNAQTGRKGYFPVCETIWEGGRRLKPTEIFARFGARKFESLSSSVVESHLRGNIVAGAYAIRPDDTCIFLAADFDGDGWQGDAGGYRDEAARLGIECLVEISRSGNGAHGWILFAEPVQAAIARRLGSLLLAKAAARHQHLRLDTYDRFFPNQDFLPKGGFGNLIALPLQKERRADGCTEFVDEFFVPHPDQWQVLTAARRLNPDDLRAILDENLTVDTSGDIPAFELEEQILRASQDDTLDLPVLPDWEAWFAENLIIPTKKLSDGMVGRLKALATIPNPVFYEKQRQRFPTYNIPRCIFSGEVHGDRIVLPRGCREAAVELFAACGSRLEIEDRRLAPKRVRLAFTGELMSHQETATAEMLRHEHGVLVAPPGSGKTVMGCAMIGKRKVATLILVNRQTLLEQWLNRLQEFLGLSKAEVGQWRGARKKLSGRVDVAMIQTLANVENPKTFFRDYGYVVVDECHHIPAVTLEALLKECGSRFITGLTATPERKDRLERLLYHQCGPVRHFMSPGEQDDLAKQVFLKTSIFTASQDDGKPLPLHLVWQRMVADGPRNEQIASDVATVIREGRVPIVLSDRKEHLGKLSEIVAAKFSYGEVGLVTIEGSLSPRKRDAALAAFSGAVHEKRPACLFATSSLLGEGFDLPILDTLFLTMPIAFKGRLVQYAGRLHRVSPGKENVLIYDYLDEMLPLACSMYRKRLPAYRSMGYVILKGEAAGLNL